MSAGQPASVKAALMAARAKNIGADTNGGPKARDRQSAPIEETTKQIRKLQLRVYDVMSLCNMAVVAECSEQDGYEPQRWVRIAARELDAIWRELDIAATALEVSHGEY